MEDGLFQASWHEIYLIKKSASKIIMQQRGLPFKEAFDMIPDEAVTDKDYTALAELVLSGEVPKKKKKSK